MKIGTEVSARQAGAISSGLVGLAGFAAGALLMGLVAFHPRPAPAAAESARVPGSNGATAEADSRTNLQERTRPSQADPSASAFESGTPGPAHPPGRQRADLLSAPDGWTPEISVGP